MIINVAKKGNVLLFLISLISPIAFSSSQTDKTTTNSTNTNLQQEQYNWPGFYIGGSGGWGWTKLQVSATPFGSNYIQSTLPVAFSNTNINGGLFSGQLGINQIIGRFILGIEGDFTDINISGSKISRPSNVINAQNGMTNYPNGFSASDDIKWLASARGRIGVLWKSSLLYLTAGGAWERYATQNTFTFSGFNYPDGWIAGSSMISNVTKTKVGYILGGGYERFITTGWSVRGEYLFYGFSSNNTNNLSPQLVDPITDLTVPGGIRAKTDNTNINLIRLGVNYHFS